MSTLTQQQIAAFTQLLIDGDQDVIDGMARYVIEMTGEILTSMYMDNHSGKPIADEVRRYAINYMLDTMPDVNDALIKSIREHKFSFEVVPKFTFNDVVRQGV